MQVQTWSKIIARICDALEFHDAKPSLCLSQKFAEDEGVDFSHTTVTIGVLPQFVIPCSRRKIVWDLLQYMVNRKSESNQSDCEDRMVPWFIIPLPIISVEGIRYECFSLLPLITSCTEAEARQQYLLLADILDSIPRYQLSD